MVKLDDSQISPEQLNAIRQQAFKALCAADAIGCYPTPVDAIMDRAKVVVVEEDVLDERFLDKLRRKAGNALKRALSKILGVLDVKSRLVYIDKTVKTVRQTFLKLHETAHAVLPWQRDIYGVVEDCEKTIAPEISEGFDKEANTFASEVLFQLDDFTKLAADEPFGIKTPLKLNKKYGASVYAAVRRYVSTNHRNCAVVVINPPEFAPGDGFKATLRRVVSSPSFDQCFGTLDWPTEFTPNDQIGAMIPIGKRKMSGPRNISLRDRNGTLYECIAESFTQGYQVFVLIHAVSSLTKKSIVF